MEIKSYHLPRREDHVLLESIGLRARDLKLDFVCGLCCNFHLYSIKHQEAILLKGKEHGMKEKGRNETSRKQGMILKIYVKLRES